VEELFGLFHRHLTNGDVDDDDAGEMDSRGDYDENEAADPCNRILGMEELDRLCLYERQISASFRHLVSQLERHQARRLGVPVPAPVAVDLSVSHHGAQSEIPLAAQAACPRKRQARR
jgi:hypothetical protein